MKILFINPPNDPFSSAGILIEPVDLLQCASYAQILGMDVCAFDMDVKKCSAQDLELYFKDKYFDAVIVMYDHHIPLHDTQASVQALMALGYFKNKGSFTALAGKAASFLDHTHFKDSACDVLIHKEVEPFLEQLAKKGVPRSLAEFSDFESIRYWRKGLLLDTPPAGQFDLNKLPALNRTLLDIDDYIDVRTILTSRGCNLKCTFCHVPGYWGGWRGRSPGLVADEIIQLQQSHPESKILLLDDNATAQPLRMRELSHQLTEKGNKAPLGCLATIVSYDEKTFDKMHEAGFRWIHFGAESADDAILKDMLKKTTYEKTKNVLQKCKSQGFRLRTSWVMDMPGVTHDSLLRTCDAILELQTPEIRLHFLALRLGSLLAEVHGTGAKQFIHNSRQNVNLTQVSPEFVWETVSQLITNLQAQGYTLVTNAHEFENMDIIRAGNPDLKIVSLCPLRYGLNWKF